MSDRRWIQIVASSPHTHTNQFHRSLVKVGREITSLRVAAVTICYKTLHLFPRLANNVFFFIYSSKHASWGTWKAGEKSIGALHLPKPAGTVRNRRGEGGKEILYTTGQLRHMGGSVWQIRLDSTCEEGMLTLHSRRKSCVTYNDVTYYNNSWSHIKTR